MRQQAFGLTDVGRCRAGNEDNLYLDPALGLYAVADGMGGHAAGEVASQLAIESLAESIGSNHRGDLKNPESAALLLETAFRKGNQKICESVSEHGEWQGMGTTIVALLCTGASAVIGHVGDSRAYRLRDGRLHRLTSDHSWVNEQVKLGLLTDQEAQRHPMRNIVTRALGNRNELKIDTQLHTIQTGDLFLLCSDGLNTMIEDAEIARMLTLHSSNPEDAARALVAEANRLGGEDNITVIVVRAEACPKTDK